MQCLLRVIIYETYLTGWVVDTIQGQISLVHTVQTPCGRSLSSDNTILLNVLNEVQLAHLYKLQNNHERGFK